MTATLERRVELTRAYHFSAAHRLENPRLSADDNRRLYGPCHRLHGHNYDLEVTVAGVPDPVTGMAVDIAAIDEIVTRRLLDDVDHRALEDVASLAGVITTGESLARAFWRILTGALAPARLVRIVVVETAKNRFEYRGEDEE